MSSRSAEPGPAPLQETIAAAARDLEAGRLDRAEAACRELLGRLPGQPDALHLLGIAAHQAGDLAAAGERIASALAARPGEPTFHDSLGVVQQSRGEPAAAEASHRRALELEPKFAAGWFNLGNALGAQRRTDQAIAAYRRALELDPELVPAHINLGVALVSAGELEAAAEAQRRALALDPGMAAAHNNLAAALLGLDRPEEAVAELERAIAGGADFPLGHLNLAAVRAGRGELEAAIDGYRRAAELRPQVAVLHLNLALSLLQASRFEEGWREYEWRWRRAGAAGPKRGFGQPAWDGAPLAGRRILLVDEQGLGDTLMFIRYAPLVAARGGRVYAECAPPLGRLLAGCPGIERLVVGGAEPPGFDLQVALLSLPGIFGTDLDSIPGEVPYLAAPGPPLPGVEEALAAAPPGTLRVGLAWAGNPDHPADRLRSCPAARLAPLAALPGVTPFSLQFGDRGGELADLERAAGRPVADLGPLLGDFADTAAIVERLDLVVAVDTSIVHLAGALGRPVWTLLGAAADWRWMSGREDSPWYPSMRLFRQRRPGDWDELAERAAAALALLAAATCAAGVSAAAG